MDYQLSDFKNIKHFIFDIDGVLTDGSLLISQDGTLLRTMNIKDGYAMQLAVKKGYTISIISGAKGECLKNRFHGLGIDDVHLGIQNKSEILTELIQNKGIDILKSLYMGDDMPDIELMKTVFLPTSPIDACEQVKLISKYISPFAGGRGCVRDVIEKVLQLNHNWE